MIDRIRLLLLLVIAVELALLVWRLVLMSPLPENTVPGL